MSADTDNHFEKAFAVAVKPIILQLGWGGQVDIAKAAGIKPSYLNDILMQRKYGTEKTRRAISFALEKNYQDLIALGFKLLDGERHSFISEKCGQYEMFSENKALCIYRLAAKHRGIAESWFFSKERIKALKPPGWAEYLSGIFSDGELYKTAKNEMKILQELLKKDVK